MIISGKSRWSIGMLRGRSIETLRPISHNPIITQDMVSDKTARFVADPCLFFEKDKWYIFFEVFPTAGNCGSISVATSNNLEEWHYRGTVLELDIHVSYPIVFKHENQFYMIVETLEYEAVCLFQAEQFPNRWRFRKRLLEGLHADPTIFFHNDHWWMFTCPEPYRNDTLNLYLSEKLEGPWRPFSNNPLRSKDTRNSRPAGPVFNDNNSLIRFAQNCEPHYGASVNSFDILSISNQEYKETPRKLHTIFGNKKMDWNANGQHHISIVKSQSGEYIACIDGRAKSLV